MVNGKMENNMEKVFIKDLMELKRKDNGLKEKRSNGFDNIIICIQSYVYLYLKFILLQNLLSFTTKTIKIMIKFSLLKKL